MLDLSFLKQEHLLEAFQDLIDLDSDGGPTRNTGVAEDEIDADVQIHKLDASSLTLTDVIAELERRGLQPKGFYSDDAKRLQRCFDDEHEVYVETKRKELRDAKIAEAEENRERHKKALIENEVLEEKGEISNNTRVSEWFRLILTKACPLECRINVNGIIARSLAKALWSDSRITAIDVSNMNLSDKAGAYLARALKNNRTMSKLEMNENKFGSETCKSLANSLATNNTLAFLSIGSNLLAKSQNGDDRGCIELLASSIGKNSGLVFLSLWRCGIGPEGGKAICNAVSNNTNLISVEVGYNNFDNDDILLLTKGLEANRRIRDLSLEKEAELVKDQERVKQDELKAKKEKQEKELNQQWLEEQKNSRAELRREKQARKEEDTRKENETKQQMEHIQKLEEERTKAKNKKKKGKKGGGKKGKKK